MNVDEGVRSALESHAALTPQGRPRGAGEAMRKGRRRRIGKRVGVVTAVVAGLVGFLGFALLATPADQSPANPPPASTLPVTTTVPVTTTLPITTTAVPPTTVAQDLNGGFGTVSWTEHDTAPPGAIVSTRSGFAALGDERSGESSGFSLWTSDDGIDWTESAVPTMDSESAQLHSTVSGVWLIGDDDADEQTGADPVELWHSPDLSDWRRVDLGDFREASLGLWWRTSINAVASVGDVTIVHLELSLGFDWATILGIEAGDYGSGPIGEFDETRTGEEGVEPGEGDGVFAVAANVGEDEEGQGQLVAEVRFENNETGLLLVDNITDEEIIFFPSGTEGWDPPEAIDDGMFGYAGGNGEWSGGGEALLVAGPDGVRAIDPATGASAPFVYCSQNLIDLDGQVLVIGCDEDGSPATFVTSDGVTWKEGPQLPDLVGYAYDPDSGYWYGSTYGVTPAEHWISSDGVDWRMVDVDSSVFSSLLRLDDGWVVVRYDQEGGSGLSTSSDGETWSTIEGAPSNDRLRTLGNSLVAFGEGTTWVGVVTFNE